MKDLIQCMVHGDGFQQWMSRGTVPLTVMREQRAAARIVRLEKDPSVDYLYGTSMGRENAISWDNSLTFCGVYHKRDKALYLTQDSLSLFAGGQDSLVERAGSSMTEVIRDGINRRVEEIIANDRNNLPVREITDWQMLKDLEYFQEHGAREHAVWYVFDDKIPDGQFHSAYKLERLREDAFLAYLRDPEGFIQTEAEAYINRNQEKFLLEFLENDALLAAYQALVQDTANPVHRMKAITDAVRSSGAKSVNVTVRKDGQELTFKTAANSLTGHRHYYSTYEIPASDRREFERLFGRHADYRAEDIVSITYGRNTIYEAPPAQAEGMAENIETGGMQFG